MSYKKQFTIYMQDPRIIRKLKDINPEYEIKERWSIDEQVEDFVDSVYDMLEKSFEENNWYYGDSLEITINFEYIPEDK